MESQFAVRLHHIVAFLDPRVRARPQRYVDWVLDAGVRSYRDLLALIQDQSAAAAVREAACWIALQLHDLRAVPALLAVLQDSGDRFDVRHAAARALGVIANARTADMLAAMLRAPGDVHLRFLAAYALSAKGDERAVKPLVDRLNDPAEEPRVRGLAAEALANVAHKDEQDRAFGALLAALSDPVVEVRFWAAFALGSVGDVRALPALEQVAARDQGVLCGQRSVCQEAANAIEGIRAWEQCCQDNPELS